MDQKGNLMKSFTVTMIIWWGVQKIELKLSVGAGSSCNFFESECQVKDGCKLQTGAFINAR